MSIEWVANAIKALFTESPPKERTYWSGREGDTRITVSTNGGPWTLRKNGDIVLFYDLAAQREDVIELVGKGLPDERIRLFADRMHLYQGGVWSALARGRWCDPD